MAEWAIIFDVDGVLLELTRAEEELFFEPFASRCDAQKLSRDWNSYKIRNDEDIVAEILARHGLPASQKPVVIAEYLLLLGERLASHQLRSQEITGARALLEDCLPLAKLGIATANLRLAAQLRLQQIGLWAPVKNLAFGADGGGHKSQILARAIAASGLPPSRIIFIGDNLNDVAAGQNNGVHFIGFSTDKERLQKLAAFGAKHLSNAHVQTRLIIRSILQA